MLDPKHLDDLTRRLSGSLPRGLQALQEDISRNLRAALEAGLGKLDLVTREEFEVQSAVLARTREKLNRLEAEVAKLERQLSLGAPAKKKTTPRKTTKRPS
jgi:BMFP domain-containing protein YqiC